MNPIETNLTRLDLLQSTPTLVLRTKAYWIIPLIFWVFITFNMYFRVLPERQGGEIICQICSIFVASFVATIFAGIVFLAFILLTIISIFTIGKNRGILGKHLYTIGEEGLIEETSINKTIMRWPSIISLLKKKNYIYVKVQPGGYHILPRRCFENQETYNRFFHTLESASLQ